MKGNTAARLCTKPVQLAAVDIVAENRYQFIDSLIASFRDHIRRSGIRRIQYKRERRSHFIARKGKALWLPGKAAESGDCNE